MADEKWLKRTVAQGLGKLVVLRLANQPPEEMIKATAEVWVQVILSQRIYGGWQEKEDKWRIEQAFMRLCAECERFPAPKMLLDRLPKRKTLELPPPQPKPLTPEQQAHVSKMLNEWRGVLNAKR
ncbi:conserved hypothetical protein [Histophilus somni 2336]|uniref:hypothetical protein n=1 Tax=Histophilus somni TaxID=731 RepID=UPI000045D69E|nr:hypothetical protein [Histophilus somni]ACA32314.1 conserved hypothetical protein [Histophilus somni 2336]